MKKYGKKVLSLMGILGFILLLVVCFNKLIISYSIGIWDYYIVYNCLWFIIWLFNIFGGYGMGIIIFMIIIWIIILLLMFY